MEIKKVKWANKEHTVVNVDGMFVPLPCETWHKEFIDVWFEKNEPEPFQTVDERKAELVREVERKVTADISSVLSLGEQINAVARSAELVNKKVDKEITPEETAELEGLKDVYAMIKAINAEAEKKVEEINKSDKPDEIGIIEAK